MESLSMDRVYDYMFHLVSEYSKLLDFKPVPPSTASEVCVHSMLCFANEKQRMYLNRSMAFPSQTPPCTLHDHAWSLSPVLYSIESTKTGVQHWRIQNHKIKRCINHYAFIGGIRGEVKSKLWNVVTLQCLLDLEDLVFVRVASIMWANCMRIFVPRHRINKLEPFRESISI